MSSHRPQTPRGHLVSPGNFGHAAQVDWRQPTSLEWLIHLRHAEVQHAFVARLRQIIRETRGLSQAVIARGGSRMENDTVPLYPYKRLNDGINGHKRMSLVDMQRIELITGLILPSLHVERTIVLDASLRAQFPLAVGELPTPVPPPRASVTRDRPSTRVTDHPLRQT